METLIPRAAEIGEMLKARKETIGIAESSTGGLISAALLAQPGASAYYLGGAVVYTRQARSALTSITDDDMRQVRSARRTARRNVGARGDGRDGTDRKPLRRSSGPLVHRHFRPDRRGDHAAHRVE